MAPYTTLRIDVWAQLFSGKFVWTASNPGVPTKSLSVFTRTFNLANASIATGSKMLIGVDGSCHTFVNNVYVGSTVTATLPLAAAGATPMYIPTGATTATFSVALRCSRGLSGASDPTGGLIAVLLSSRNQALGWTDGAWAARVETSAPYDATLATAILCKLQAKFSTVEMSMVYRLVYPNS
jgi:hypothetical protein